MRTVYLSGPISNGGTATPERIKRNEEKFKEIRLKFDPSTRVLDPTQILRQETWEDYMKLTIAMLCEADFMVLLPGWEESRGAVLEVFLANTLNIPITFSDHIPF